MSALDFLKQLWPSALCELIASETNRYAIQKGRRNWSNTNADEVWTFLGIILFMGIHRLPRMKNYWSKDEFLGIPALKRTMSISRFWALWTNVHVVDNETTPPGDGQSVKIKPLLDVLGRTFYEHYNPGQELSVDEAMVKYKRRGKGKVRMPKKPIKCGFKVWSCSCSCCGYLCSFQVYDGKPTDPVTGEKMTETGMVRRVVTDLLDGFTGSNHVVYCDNFYTSGPLADELAKGKIYMVGKCRHCLSTKERGHVKHTSFACSLCQVRLCKLGCFEDYHA